MLWAEVVAEKVMSVGVCGGAMLVSDTMSAVQGKEVGV